MTKDFTFDTSVKGNLKIWVYSFKKHALSILFFLFCIGLVCFSKNNLEAAKTGLILWATAVVPSLFPFFVATELLSYTNIISFLGKHLNFLMRPLFGVPGEASFAFLMGLISGYPVGAKVVCNLYEEGKCTKEEAERMLAFTNNSGPLFIIGTVGITLFANTKIGILLLVTHILACITTGIFSNFFRKKKEASNLPFSHHISSNKENIKEALSFSSLGSILGKSITNAISTVLLIGGFVVIFSVVLSIISESHILSIASNFISPLFLMFHIPTGLISPILAGIIELTNGVSFVAAITNIDINFKIITCAFLLGFGGFSVLLQVFSIISKYGLGIRKYFIGKLWHGAFAAIYTYLALQFFAIL